MLKLNALCAGLTAIFSREARRDNLLGAIGHDTAQKKLTDAEYKTRMLVQRFADDPQIVAPVETMINFLRQAGRRDSALDIGLQTYRLAAADSPLREKADSLCRAIADSYEDPVQRAGIWGDIARAAPAETDLRRAGQENWEGLVKTLPTAQDRATACLSMAELTYYSGQSRTILALRDQALGLAESFVKDVPDEAARASLCRRAILLAAEFSDAETRWLEAWDKTVRALPPAQAWTACVEASTSDIHDGGRSDSLLLRDAAAFRMQKLAEAMPPSVKKLESLVSAASYRQEVDGPKGDGSQESAAAWKAAFAALPESDGTLEQKLRLCRLAALEMGPGAPLTQAAVAEWNKLVDLIADPAQRRQVCLDAAKAARDWDAKNEPLAKLFEQKAASVKVTAPAWTPMTPTNFVQHIKPS